jgi:hypothetical protein
MKIEEKVLEVLLGHTIKCPCGEVYYRAENLLTNCPCGNYIVHTSKHSAIYDRNHEVIDREWYD